jgi:hypothetical protein
MSELRDLFFLPDGERPAALAQWFSEVLDRDALRHAGRFDDDELTGWFSDGPFTYLVSMIWTPEPADVDDVRPMVLKLESVPAAAPMRGGVLSLSGFTTRAEEFVRASAGGRVLLLTRIDAVDLEVLGVSDVFARAASSALASVPPSKAPSRPGGFFRKLWHPREHRAEFVLTVASVELGLIGLAVAFWPRGTVSTVVITPPAGASSFVFDLEPPVDRDEVVELTWEPKPGYTYLVEAWSDNGGEPERKATTESSIRLPVQAKLHYCFQVQAVATNGTFGVSNIEPIRGASCKVVD